MVGGGGVWSERGRGEKDGGMRRLRVAEKIVLLLAYCNMNPEHVSSCAYLSIGAMMATHNAQNLAVQNCYMKASHFPSNDVSFILALNWFIWCSRRHMCNHSFIPSLIEKFLTF